MNGTAVLANSKPRQQFWDTLQIEHKNMAVIAIP
jgi:hypothetical protein